MPTDRQLKIINAVHRGLIKVTGGRVGTGAKGISMITLTTVGRRSGKPHRVILAVPVVDGESLVIVASRAGDPIHPAWLHNLRANPSVEVALGTGPARPMTARELPRAERDRVWRDVVAAAPGYGDYQKKTTRVIPLVMLTPGRADGPRPAG